MAGVLGLASAVCAGTLAAEPRADNGDVVLLPAATTSALPGSAETAFKFFVRKGLTPVQAAGVVGNLMQESHANPRAVQEGGPGRGIAQWSMGARWSSLVSFAHSHSASPWSLDTQLQFLWHELSTVPGYGLDSLRAAKTVPAATEVFAKRFEVCGECRDQQRIAFAHEALSAFRGRVAQRPSA
jgi:hypothetical protein